MRTHETAQRTKTNQSRRNHMRAWLAALLPLLTPLGACSQDKTPPMFADEDAALKHKFRDIRGGELLVDAVVYTQTSIIYRPDGTLFAGLFGVYSPTNRLRSGYFGDEKKGDQFAVPKTLRMLRYAQDAVFNQDWNGHNIGDQGRWLGSPVVDITVPVASRIPEAALDRVRQYKGSLTLKLRLMPETLLIGWEVKDGRSYPFKLDKGGGAYYAEGERMVVGDFCEARPRLVLMPNGMSDTVHQKGWYIDPKTGQKIETDF